MPPDMLLAGLSAVGREGRGAALRWRHGRGHRNGPAGGRNGMGRANWPERPDYLEAARPDRVLNDSSELAREVALRLASALTLAARLRYRSFSRRDLRLFQST